MGEGPEEKQQERNRLFFVPVYISMQIIINLTPLKHQHKEQTQAQGIKVIHKVYTKKCQRFSSNQE